MLYLISRFDCAVQLLPHHLQAGARFLDEAKKAEAEEIRLRIGSPPTVLLPGGEKKAGSAPVTQSDLNGVLEIVSMASAHAVRESMKNGYITAKGGFRVGFCGSAVVRDGEVTGFRDISSVAIRITKEIKGAADGVMAGLFQGGRFLSTLIISPPGGGKTTLLRDILRQLSRRGIRVSVADERGEVAGMKDGAPQMDIGPAADVIDNCPKDKAILMLLRAMNPQVIAVDEVTAAADAQALRGASNCGVGLLATAHAEDLADLQSKKLYRDMLEEGLFSRALLISLRDGKRDYQVAHPGR